MRIRKAFETAQIFTFLLGMIILLGSNAHAQRPVFRVGDRVSASPSSLKDEKYWRSCTVTEVHNFVPKRAYSLKCDPQNAGGSFSEFLVNEDWVKPLAQGPGDAANTGTAVQQPRVAAAPPPQMAGAVACPPPDDGGANALERSFRASIRQSFSHEPRPGEDGRITVAVQALSVGIPHAYRVYEDPNESRGKTIYPIRATFTTCTDYNTRIVFTKRERAFSCYKNTAGEWVCDIHAAANTNVKDETKSIDKPRH